MTSKERLHIIHLSKGLPFGHPERKRLIGLIKTANRLKDEGIQDN